MTNDEYLETQNQLCYLGNKLRGLNLISFLEWIQHAESTGFVMDPTLYRDAQNQTNLIREMARAAQQLVRAHDELIDHRPANDLRGHTATQRMTPPRPNERRA